MEEPIPECPLRDESFTTRSEVVGALLFYDWRVVGNHTQPESHPWLEEGRPGEHQVGKLKRPGKSILNPIG